MATVVSRLDTSATGVVDPDVVSGGALIPGILFEPLVESPSRSIVRYGTVTMISFEGDDTSAPFTARTRTRYVPAGTFGATSYGVVPSASPGMRFARPGAVPASST